MYHNKYMIGTGYWASPSKVMYSSKTMPAPEFFDVWWENTHKYTAPEGGVTVINANSPVPPNAKGDWINLQTNAKHVRDMNGKHLLGGWSVGVQVGASLAYAHGYDFVYKEQDCLAFGNWIESLQKDIHDRNLRMLIGKWVGGPYLVEQSLMYIRWEYIPMFLSNWLSIPQSDKSLRPELKYLSMQQQSPQDIGFMTMEGGRTRPIQESLPVYAQQLSKEELNNIRGLYG